MLSRYTCLFLLILSSYCTNTDFKYKNIKEISDDIGVKKLYVITKDAICIVGTGFCINKLYMMTAAHVYENVEFLGYYNNELDIAIFEYPECSSMKTLPFGYTYNIINNPVLSVGYPAENYMPLFGYVEDVETNHIKLNMYVLGGSSGSPVIDFDGQILGLITYISMNDTTYNTYAVRSDRIMEWLINSNILN